MTKIKSKSFARANLADKAIIYHDGMEDSLSGWAESCGLKPRQFKQLSEKAIRTRHSEAKLEEPIEAYPVEVFTLPINDATMYYTVEPIGVVIRGYSWEIVGEPVDDFAAGGFFTEFDWLKPPNTK